MNEKTMRSSYAPGDHVFLQGEVVPSFFKVTSGRFAKVYSKKSVQELGVRRMLNEADLIGIVSHQELFGEIEALMGRPQGFSVFALDSSSAETVPADSRETLQQVLSTDPKVGVRACISFAHYMKSFFAYFAGIAKEEVELEAFIRSTARDYMAGVNELANVVCPIMNDPDLTDAKAHKAYEAAREILRQAEVKSGSSASVACGVVSYVGKDVKMQKFKAGELLCKEGTIGDKLFIITEGAAEVVTSGGSNNIVIDAPGSIVGEIAVFLNLDAQVPDMRRTADVACATDLTAIVVQLGQVEDFFLKQPEIMTKMLMAMVNRSENTRKLCEHSEKVLKEMLYAKLGILLEGLNNMAKRLADRHDKASLGRPAAFFAQRARATYNRFKESLDIIARKSTIKT
ncbi:MAG: cyclic nucleotide-binding domain-containing protein [Candidatus Riflebacteria bacterium]|nr:cyclic nucleotide-binding domain-containing protein [Candidatus Riflebacteria bacterium]